MTGVAQIFADCLSRFVDCEMAAEKTSSALISEVEKGICVTAERECLFTGLDAYVQELKVSSSSNQKTGSVSTIKNRPILTYFLRLSPCTMDHSWLVS